MHNNHHSIQVPCKFQINRFINNREVDDPNTRAVDDQGTRAVDIPSIRAVDDPIQSWVILALVTRILSSVTCFSTPVIFFDTQYSTLLYSGFVDITPLLTPLLTILRVTVLKTLKSQYSSIGRSIG